MSDEHRLHPVVQELLDAFVAEAGGPRLPVAALAAWAERLRREPGREPLARELVVVALRLRARGAVDAVNQVVWLVAGLLGAESAAEALREAGLPTAEARELLRAARGVAPPLAGGLTPPATGAGLRKRR